MSGDEALELAALRKQHRALQPLLRSAAADDVAASFAMLERWLPASGAAESGLGSMSSSSRPNRVQGDSTTVVVADQQSDSEIQPG